MLENNCRICQKGYSLTSLIISGDIPDETYAIKVCSTCWDAIATIAQKQLEDIETRLRAVEIRLGFVLPEPLPEADGASTFEGSVDYGGNGDGQELENIF